MVGNENEAPIRRRAEELAGRSAFFARLLEAARSHPEPFRLAEDGEGLDLGADNRVQGRPNRARLKAFSLPTGRLAVFFYKPSLLPFSRDRYGYGGRVFDPAGVPPEEIRQWLDFLAAGMPPDRRPDNLLRGFPYDVPR
ncbi:MAG: hypothetical protein HY509_01670 [Acidobacteria bacterium]|nr:hypothetical protein [Acidobacteriota bacterium]